MTTSYGRVTELERSKFMPVAMKLPRILTLFALVAGFLVMPISAHVRATKLLLAFSDPNVKPDVVEAEDSIKTPDGRIIPARLYRPAGKGNYPGVVMVHGVQRKGIDEPRLQRFARAVAGSGLVVLTPEVAELSDYHVAKGSIDTVGAAVNTLRSRIGHDRVGLMGMSFGGGIAMLTAADPRFADQVAFVVAIGAHDDLARVSGFFATNDIENVDGKTEHLHAHDYGAMVLVYTHVDDFFPAEDVPAARDALRLWLWEEQSQARAIAETMRPEARAKVETLFKADLAGVRGELLEEIERHRPEMSNVSPHGHLDGMKAHVYLLHGEGDTVIPPTETRWLAKDTPKSALRAVLVSKGIQHVELKEPTLGDKWDLVHFMGRIMSEADGT